MSAENQNPESNASLPIAGVLAEFDGPEAVKAAAAKVRAAGYRRWDVHSPYPIHGIERAMGVRHTVLPWLVLGGGRSAWRRRCSCSGGRTRFVIPRPCPAIR